MRADVYIKVGFLLGRYVDCPTPTHKEQAAQFVQDAFGVDIRGMVTEHAENVITSILTECSIESMLDNWDTEQTEDPNASYDRAMAIL